MLGIAPTAIRALMGKGAEWVQSARPLLAAHPGLDRRDLESRPVALVLRRSRRGALPDHQLLGRHRNERRHRRLRRRCGRSSPAASPPRCPAWTPTCVDDEGQPVRGEVGELVVRQPWVGMTRGFWRDPERYLETYWSRIPGVWVHGDWAEIDDDGHWFILGRSDDTLKVAGKRVGPAEVESAASAHPAVQEAAAIGVPHEVKGECDRRLCRPATRHRRPAMRWRRRCDRRSPANSAPRCARSACSGCDDLPKTRNAKIMRRVIRAAYLGLPPGDITALENPAAVEAIAALTQPCA